MRSVAILSILVIAGFASAFADETQDATQTPPAREQDARMTWWREARFGMFIHWGLYAIPAGEWNGQTNHAEWIRHTAHIPIETYDKFVPQFNPVKFNADEWARMAKDAGMKYVVITSKHHDGFCLFDSKYTDYDVMSTPFKRDIMKELAAACRAQGLTICWYHSIMDWHHPDYLPRRGWEKDRRSAEGADFDRFNEHLKHQVGELLTNYGPIGVMWFDGQWENTWTHEHGLDLYEYCRGLQSDLIINNRVDVGRGKVGLTKDAKFAGDFGTPEQEIPASGLPGMDWETCMTMNDHWGYNSHDDHWKSTEDLIRKLADIASKGGNFLLNIGPKADGTFPEPCVERLREIGRWMMVNGDSIYGTNASPFQQQLPWGRCTQKPLDGNRTRLYLHVFDWPTDGKLAVPGLSNEALAARRMTDEAQSTLPFERQEDALEIQVGPTAPDPIDSVVVLDIAGKPDVIEPPVISAERDIFIDEIEISIVADRENVELRYTLDGGVPTSASPRATGPVRLSQTATVAARVFRDGRPLSAVRTATFTKVQPRPAVNTDGYLPGLRFDYYEGEWDRLPDFDKMTPVESGRLANFSFLPRNRTERFGIRYSGVILLPRPGIYTFYTTSDDGSRLFIGDQRIVDNDGLHTKEERSGFIALAAGAHPLSVVYFNKTGGKELHVFYSGPGVEKQPIPVDALRCAPETTESR